MNLYEYIKNDHRKVDAMFKKLKSSTNAKQQVIFKKIMHELFIHAESEQATFYDTLEKYKPVKTDVKHAKEEHKEIADMMNAITKMDPTSPAWLQKVIKLGETVEHHVHEEETEVFKDGKEYLTDEQTKQILKDMKFYKKKVKEQF